MAAAELSYTFDGPPGAPVLVLSASLGTDRTMWDPQVEALSGRMRLLRYDMRGHGSSPVPPAPYSMADLGGDLLALLDRLEIERASLCGVSIGGMIGMWLGAHAPERVERLVLCCTTPYMGPPDAWHERAATVRARGVGAIADAILGRWFTPEYAEAHPALISQMRDLLSSTPREGYAGCCEALAGMDLRPDLASIQAPTLVLAGEEDPSIPLGDARLLADRIPGAQLSVVPHAAHLASVERAELVSTMILRFVLDSQEGK